MVVNGFVLNPPNGLERCHRYFCYVCGTLLPQKVETNESIICGKCKTPTHLRWFVGMRMKFTDGMHDVCEDVPMEYMNFFPKMAAKARTILNQEAHSEHVEEEDNADGPTIRKDCAYCGNDRMSYITLQTRSADEGQTVIYTCTKCFKKEVENT